MGLKIIDLSYLRG